MSMLSMPANEDPQPHGPGWLSGPCPDPRPSAALPAYNPSMLAVKIQELLGEAGITTVIDLGNSATVVNACADVLRAMGVAPQSAPWRSR